MASRIMAPTKATVHSSAVDPGVGAARWRSIAISPPRTMTNTQGSRTVG